MYIYQIWSQIKTKTIENTLIKSNPIFYQKMNERTNVIWFIQVRTSSKILRLQKYSAHRIVAPKLVVSTHTYTLRHSPSPLQSEGFLVSTELCHWRKWLFHTKKIATLYRSKWWRSFILLGRILTGGNKLINSNSEWYCLFIYFIR